MVPEASGDGCTTSKPHGTQPSCDAHFSCDAQPSCDAHMPHGAQFQGQETDTAADDSCATRWPLLLVHGIGFRDNWRLRYWGRIPEALTARGASVHYGFQDAWGSVEDNARFLQNTLFAVLEQTGQDKVNIIAHSKGGLDTRRLAAQKDCTPHIASITTMSSPHAGSRAMDALMRIPAPLFKAMGVIVNACFRLLGDTHPNFYNVCRQLTTASMQDFNRRYPLPDTLWCQSYAGVMNKLSEDVLMAVFYLFVRHFEAPNDGLVSVDSASSFGLFRGVVRDRAGRGVSHSDLVDRRRKPRAHKDTAHGQQKHRFWCPTNGPGQGCIPGDNTNHPGIDQDGSRHNGAKNRTPRNNPDTNHDSACHDGALDDDSLGCSALDDGISDIINLYIEFVAELKAHGL